MGRWAQRRRAGGGSPVLNSMIYAAAVGGADADVTYATTIDAAELDPDSFTSNPSGEQGLTINQLTDTKIEISFSGDVSGDTTLLYAGVVIGIRTPQTISYT